MCKLCSHVLLKSSKLVSFHSLLFLYFISFHFIILYFISINHSLSINNDIPRYYIILFILYSFTPSHTCKWIPWTFRAWHSTKPLNYSSARADSESSLPDWKRPFYNFPFRAGSTTLFSSPLGMLLLLACLQYTLLLYLFYCYSFMFCFLFIYGIFYLYYFVFVLLMLN